MLSTSVGGAGGGMGGAGGVALAYQAPPGASGPSGPAAAPKITAAPTSAAALGADVSQKKFVASSTDGLPLVAVDFEAPTSIASVAYAPAGQVAMPVPLYASKRPDGARNYIEKNGTNLRLLRADGATNGAGTASFKALKRMLLRGGPGNVGRVVRESLCPASLEEVGTGATIVSPHGYLGARNLTAVGGTSSGGDIPAVLGTLDGASPRGDDDDRVVFPLDTVSPLPAEGKKKKKLSLLPDEAAGIVLAAAKRAVFEQRVEVAALQKGKKVDEEEEENALADIPYPLAVSIPGYHLSDFYVEALQEAVAYSGSNVDLDLFFHRHAAAFVGAFLMRLKKDPKKNKSGDWDGLIRVVMGEVKRLADNRDQKGKKCRSANEQPVILTVGLTASGYDIHFLQVGNMGNGIFPFETINTIASSCALSSSAVTDFDDALSSLIKIFSRALPGRRPCAVVTYGSEADQAEVHKKMKANTALRQLHATHSSPDGQAPNLFFTAPNVVSIGTAALAASTEGRLPGGAIAERPVASWAVGIRLNFFGAGKPGKVRTVFDYDRRLPASYDIDISAAECAAARARGGSCMIPDADDKDVKKYSQSKHIPDRETAAKALEFQIVQKVRRGGKYADENDDCGWVPVGGPLKPLVYLEVKQDKDGEETEGEEIGRENATLNISVNTTGLIVTKLGGDRESVVQYTRTARSDKVKYYLGILFAILFFGGFAAKSYWDEYTLNRDAERLMAYYKHITPDKLGADNIRNARYTVYRYRANLDRLWRRLEVRYGYKVPESNWHDLESYVKVEDGEHVHDLDLDDEDDEIESSEDDGEKKDEL